MKKHEENVLTMYKTVCSILKSAGTILVGLSGSQEKIEAFSGILNQIEQKETELKTLTAGKTQSKRSAEKELVDEIFKICQAMLLFSKSAKNLELAAKTKVTKTELLRLRDSELLAKVREINSLAKINESNIAGYGITNERLTALEEMINSYESKILSKETSFADKTAARGELTALFKSADELLKTELDRFVELVKDSSPDFYNMYKEARYIRNLGVRHNGVEEEQPAPEETAVQP